MKSFDKSFNESQILASVTLASSLDNIAVKHEFEQRNINVIAPKRYYYLPEIDDKILLSNIQNKLALGCLNSFKDLEIKPGEIVIKNGYGAEIKLLNNGDVKINSLTITKSGELINK